MSDDDAGDFQLHRRMSPGSYDGGGADDDDEEARSDVDEEEEEEEVDVDDDDGGGVSPPPEDDGEAAAAAAAAAPAPPAAAPVPPPGPDLREIGDLAVWSVTSAKSGNGVELLRDGQCDTFWQSDGTQPHLINIQFQRRMEITELRLYLDHRVDESYTPSRLSVRAGTHARDLKEVCLVDVHEPCGWVALPLWAVAPAASAWAGAGGGNRKGRAAVAVAAAGAAAARQRGRRRRRRREGQEEEEEEEEDGAVVEESSGGAESDDDDDDALSSSSADDDDEENAGPPPPSAAAGTLGGGPPLRAFLLQVAVLSNHQSGRDTHVRQARVYGPRPAPLRAAGLACEFGGAVRPYAQVR